MSSNKYLVEVTGPDRFSQAVLDAIGRDPRFRIHPAELTIRCTACGDRCAASDSHTIQGVQGEFCPACFTSASDILSSAREAAARHWRELLARVPEFVRRRRSGDPDPVLYREAGE